MKERGHPLLLALAVILVWSACFVVIKASGASAPPWAFAGLRALVAGITLLPLAAASGKRTPQGRSAWAWIALLGLTNTTLGLSAMFVSVGLAGAALPGVLANSQALVVAPLAAILFHERLGFLRFSGLVTGLSGVALIAGNAEGAGTFEGVAVGLAAAGGLAAANLITKHIGNRIDALTATTWQYLLGAVPLLVVSPLVEDWGSVVWSLEFVAPLVFLAVVGSALASYAWYRLVQRVELIRLNALTLLTPFFALVLALALYREPFSRGDALGVILILGGVTGVAWPPRALT